MNIVTAQLKKDLICQRGPLILWIICFVPGIITFAVASGMNHALEKHVADMSDTQKLVGALSYVAILMGCAAAAGFGMFLLVPILVARVVHDDPLMGTTAFWLTRPIPRPQLLLAKTLFIGVLLTPLLVLANGIHIGEGQFWLTELAWIASVAALASITPGMQRLLGLGLGLLFAKIVVSIIIDQLWIHYHGPDSIFPEGLVQPFSSIGQTLHLNLSDFVHLCYVIGFSAVFIHQYLTMRTRRSLLIYIALLIAAGLFQMVTSTASPGPNIQFNYNTTTPARTF